MSGAIRARDGVVNWASREDARSSWTDEFRLQMRSLDRKMEELSARPLSAGSNGKPLAEKRTGRNTLHRTKQTRRALNRMERDALGAEFLRVAQVTGVVGKTGVAK
jgi:UDP-N-acetylmuramyl pentapeptide synthase